MAPNRKKEIPCPPEKLLDIWKFISWLEKAWFSQGDLLPYESARDRWGVFRKLEPGQKLLTHWLCYIFDRVQPTARLWQDVPIFAELCNEYVSETDKDPVQLIKAFTLERDNHKEPDKPKMVKYVAKRTRGPRDERLEFTPRFDELRAVISSLLILRQNGRNICIRVAKPTLAGLPSWHDE
jgi:hypothetical protein